MVSGVDERRLARAEFIKQHVKALDKVEPLIGDAGFRRYFRAYSGDKTFICMDCPPDYCSVAPFIKIAEFLRANNFSAPEVIAEDTERGFLLLEDFGSLSIKDYITKEINNDHIRYKEIYCLIVDLLVLLQKCNVPSGLKDFDNKLLLSELELFTTWYIPHKYGRVLDPEELDEFRNIWRQILPLQSAEQKTLVLRDYHVENMMYLEQHEGIKKLGLLDFQDALLGSPLYDLVSVLEDARIDVERDNILAFVEYFAQQKGMDKAAALLDFHILGAQRNSRILGVFARKAVRDGNNNYLQYMPRVLKYLEHDLSHAALLSLKRWLEKLE